MQSSVLKNLLFALLCALFGAIYETFSHDVYSYYMIYAFMLPLALTVLPLLLLQAGKRCPDLAALRFWNYGITTLTTGCIFRGVLDIYGTTNRLLVVYPLAAALFLGTAVVIQARGNTGIHGRKQL